MRHSVVSALNVSARPVPTILIADADANARAVLARALRDVGYACVTASAGEAAFAGARWPGIGLVITDLYLAAAGERCVVKALDHGANVATRRHIAVLVYTSHTGRDDRAWAHACGCDGFLGKRGSLAAVLEAVVELIGPPARRVARCV